MAFKEKSLYKDVAAYTTETEEYVVPNNTRLEIGRFVASASYLADTCICLVWDYGGTGEEILRSCNGVIDLEVDHVLIGDNSKILAIVLENNTGSARTLGGSWEGNEYPTT